LVSGLGDVSLGAPVATPLDPRHRLVTTKYNPARTWTPENAVGIGGAYLCIYGMEGPGGYQFVGRTVQVWNAYPTAPCYVDGKPWLLRQFDRLNFYSVSADELTSLRQRFPAGQWSPKIDSGELSLAEQFEFQQQHAAEIEVARKRQQAAFADERDRWAAAGLK
jgi:urea carboxylase